MRDEAHPPIGAVDLLPVGGLTPETADELASRLSRRIALVCHVRPPAPDLPRRTLPQREQLDANALLAELEGRAGPGRLLVAVTPEDISVPVFTFVFGLASTPGRACVVSLARTDPAFYGLPPDENLRLDRTLAEILHELGHLGGLGHCPDRSCLMSFAGTVERVDTRGGTFCETCRARLPRWLAGPASPRDG
jgi:archaemetzincin